MQQVIRGSKRFEDKRGKISNYELTESINWIGLIHSKKGTIRANHYHPIQEQKALLISGKYISLFKDLSKKYSKIEKCLIKPGDLEVIKPKVAHAMIFLEDSIFINLVKGDREHKKYGKHTIPFSLVNETEVEKYLKEYTKK